MPGGEQDFRQSGCNHLRGVSGIGGIRQMASTLDGVVMLRPLASWLNAVEDFLARPSQAQA